MKRTRGFTLLEVIVALTILLVGIMGAMQLVPAAMRNARTATEREAAAHSIQSRYETLRAQGAERLFLDTEWSAATVSDIDMETLLQLDAADALYGSDTRTLHDSYLTTVTHMRGANEVYLQRVVMRVQMMDGRYEEFVTYMSRD
jgi:prepilin-type N-terminal cleavage/methylation domain-containing protein